MAVTTDPDTLFARGVAYALLAGFLGIETAALGDEAKLRALRGALTEAGAARAVRRLEGAGPAVADAGELRRRWVRWFDQGRVPPYECSNTPASAGGHTPHLADVAGFYRAFGFAVVGDRPDHVVAELEFASLVSLREAAARSAGDDEGTSVCARAARSFLRDHLGRWLDAWAARVAEIEALAPWAPYASCAAELVRADALDRNVVPVASYPVLPLDAGLLPDEAALPVCGGGAFE